ncbi:MAG: MoxR family ATPase [Chitinispirillales bacterium]|jgi:hypothetical protein|nr:MoxR family ATPase [Chitinispirillales bacterium]
MITLRQFELALRGTIDKNLKRSLMVLGPTGVGKSEMIHQVAVSYGMRVIDVRLLLWSLTDLKGIPYPDDTHTYTKWLINDILPRTERDGETGVLLLEELNAAPKTVQAAAYELTLDRRIGNYALPDGWHIIATGNREQDNGVYTAPPAPLADRFEIHEVEVDFVTWRDYAIKIGHNPAVVSYLSANQTALYTFKPEGTAELVFATPRSWQAVGNLLDAELDSEALRIKVEGNVGAVEATNFLKYLENTEKLPNIEMILNGRYLSSKKVSKYISSIDVYYLLLQNLIYAISAEFRKKSDKWRLYMENSIDFICTITKFPLEFKKSYVDQLCKINSAIKEYIYNESRNQNMSKVLQELDYII